MGSDRMGDAAGARVYSFARRGAVRKSVAERLRSAAHFRDRAVILFPDWPQYMRERWVRARLRMQGKPRVEIGIRSVDTSRPARTLRTLGGAGLESVPNIPLFLKRLIGVSE